MGRQAVVYKTITINACSGSKIKKGGETGGIGSRLLFLHPKSRYYQLALSSDTFSISATLECGAVNNPLSWRHLIPKKLSYFSHYRWF